MKNLEFLGDIDVHLSNKFLPAYLSKYIATVKGTSTFRRHCKSFYLPKIFDKHFYFLFVINNKCALLIILEIISRQNCRNYSYASLVYNKLVNHRKVINVWWFSSFKITWLKPHFEFVLFRHGPPWEKLGFQTEFMLFPQCLCFFHNAVSFSASLLSLLLLYNNSARFESLQKPRA